MNKKLLIVLLALLCLSLFAYAIKISGQDFDDLEKAGTSTPSTGGVKVIEGNPFSSETFEKSSATPSGTDKACETCSTIQSCLACIDKKLVDGVFGKPESE